MAREVNKMESHVKAHVFTWGGEPPSLARKLIVTTGDVSVMG